MTQPYVLLNNQYPVIEARVTIPRHGCWTADIVAATDAQLGLGSARSTILSLGQNGELVLTGTAKRSSQFMATMRQRIVGGGGGLAKVINGQAYNNVPLQTVLKDALLACGELLSSTADAGVLATPLPAWTRSQGPARDTVQNLADEVGATWRILPDGTLFIGPETFPSVAPSFQLLWARAEMNVAEMFIDPPTLLPGVTFLAPARFFNGFKVSSVEYRFHSGALRTNIFFEDF